VDGRRGEVQRAIERKGHPRCRCPETDEGGVMNLRTECQGPRAKGRRVALFAIACFFQAMSTIEVAAQVAAPAAWTPYLHAFDQYVAADSIVGAATLVMRDGKVLAHHETGFG